jgi:hypothetical protein
MFAEAHRSVNDKTTTSTSARFRAAKKVKELVLRTRNEGARAHFAMLLFLFIVSFF